MRIGLLGGTFNPVHVGHLRIGLECLEEYNLNKVWLIPAYIPPHKKENVLPFAQRFDLLAKAVQDVPGLEPVQIEKELGGVSFTINTMLFLRKKYPQVEFYFILGRSAFFTLPFWHRGKEILDLVHLIVVNDGANFSNLEWNKLKIELNLTSGPSCWQKGSKRVFFLECPLFAISSSLIRDKFLAQKSLRFLVPPSVEKTLEKNRAQITSIWQKSVDHKKDLKDQ